MFSQHEKQNKERKVFFGIPIVGFFRKQQTPVARVEELQPILPLTSNHQHPEHQQGSQALVKPFDSSFENSHQQAAAYADEQLEPTLSVTSPESGNGKPSSTSPATCTNPRSGKELWSILSDHSKRETFHIADFRTEEEKKKFTKHLKEMHLPYEFTLLHCLFALLVYLLIAVIAFSFVFENFTVIDSMYMAVVTFTTIGYGDVTPQSEAGKAFCIIFALGGVCVLAIALGVVGSKLVEAEVNAVEATKDELAKDVMRIFRPHERKASNVGNRRVLRKSTSDSFSYLSELDERLFHGDVDRTRWQQVADCCKGFTQVLCRYLPSLGPLIIGAAVIAMKDGRGSRRSIIVS